MKKFISGFGLVFLGFIAGSVATVQADNGIDIGRYFDRLENKLDDVLDSQRSLERVIERGCK